MSCLATCADFFRAHDSGPQVVVDFLGDVSLHRDQVGNLAVELVAPKFGAVGHVDQIGLDRQSIAALRDPAHQHGVNVEFLADFLGVDVAPLVAEHRAAGHHPQFGHAGKAADNSFGNAVGEILDVGVRAHIHEGQNGDGMNVPDPPPSNRSRRRCGSRTATSSRTQYYGGRDDRRVCAMGLVELFRRREGGNSGRFGVALDPFEVGLKFGGGLVAQLPVFFQQLGGDPAQVRNQFRIYPRSRQRRAVEDGFEYHRRSAAAKGEPSGRHFIEHGAQGKKIAAAVQFFSAGLLRGHVSHGAQRDSGAGQVIDSAQRGERRAAGLVSDLAAAVGTSFASPKSSTLACARFVRKIFAGLRSRWMIPESWAASQRIGDLDRDLQNLGARQRLARNHVLEGAALPAVPSR